MICDSFPFFLRYLEAMITPLTLAIEKEDLSACEILLSSDPPAYVNFYHRLMACSYLSRACLKQSLSLTRMLIRFGADPDRGVDKLSVNPLYIAIDNNDTEMFMTLLLAGANKENSYKKQSNEDLMITVLKQANVSFLRQLLSFDSSLAQKPCGRANQRLSPLAVAAMLGSVPKLEIIIQYGGQVNSEDFNMTPLHVAAYMGKRDVIVFLLDHGASVNTRLIHSNSFPISMPGVTGWTSALSLDCSRGNIEAVEILLMYGNASLAVSHNLCLKKQAFMEAVDKAPNVLHLMMLKNLTFIASCICHERKGLLDLAICTGHYNIACLLVVHGAMIDWKCHENVHELLIPSFPDTLIESIVMSGVANSYNTEVVPLTKKKLMTEYRKRKNTLFSLKMLCTQRLRFDMQKRCLSDFTSTSIWPWIECMMVPKCIKNMLEMKSFLYALMK